MGVGITMGLVTQPLILIVVFLLLTTPVGLVFNLVQRDTMKRKLDKGASSYREEYNVFTRCFDSGARRSGASGLQADRIGSLP